MKREYIPGDLVMTNGVPQGTAKDVVYRVTSSDPSKTLKLDDGTVLKGIVCLENIEDTKLGDKGFLFGDGYAWVKDIVPVPLTWEILEKNGWKFYELHEKIWWNGDESWISYNNITKTDINLRFYTDGNFFLPCLKDKEISGNSIKYVHELQHLLFGLGINSEMEV